MEHTPTVMTVSEFTKTFKIGRTLTYRLIAEGKLKTRKITSRKQVIVLSDALDWLNASVAA